MTSQMPIENRLRSDHELASQIRCILTDVDGVLSDGRLSYSCVVNADGDSPESTKMTETKTFHARDGLGIKLWMRCGFDFGIITARTSPVVAHRAKELGIDCVHQGVKDKWLKAKEIISSLDLTPAQVAYVGDDLPDIAVMRNVGLAVAPSDGATDAREAAHWTMQAAGGRGVVRELIERLLRGGDHWNQFLSSPAKGA